MSVLRKRISALLLLSLLFLAGCEEEKTSLSYLAVNHTAKPIDSITINNQGGVLNVPAMGGGGGEVCCVIVPSKWRPGLTAKISWLQGGHFQRDASGNVVMQNGDKVFIEGSWKTRTVPIPQYTDSDMGHFDIHFLPHDQVIVKVSFLYPHHPDYRPEYPKEASQ